MAINPFHLLQGHGYDVRDVAVSADNTKFASAGGDRQLFLWDVGTGATIRKFAGHDGVINSVRLLPMREISLLGSRAQLSWNDIVTSSVVPRVLIFHPFSSVSVPAECSCFGITTMRSHTHET